MQAEFRENLETMLLLLMLALWVLEE